MKFLLFVLLVCFGDGSGWEFLGQESSSSKRAVGSFDIFDVSKEELLAVLSLRSRTKREIGGVGSKLPHIEKKILQSCNDSIELANSLGDMKACLRTKRLFVTPRDEYIQHMDQCTQPIRKEIKECLPQKLKYLPDLLAEIAESVVRLLYDDFGEIGRGLAPCMSALNSTTSKADYERCIVKNGGHSDDDTIPESKEEFCKKFVPISECFVKQINDTCTIDKDLRKFTTDYTKAIEKPCQ
ncbi:hypothetical protein NQ315_003732 [Exocentrus adspersus]|uniref:Uncharacterized protein n=1 Tax=Exocentrus adspersus TaxID=1586481 RepID=A0AAV8VHY0_9CUCU|nr:hypothetical protein NQ315_003732 [Exocentrus adspersus]